MEDNERMTGDLPEQGMGQDPAEAGVESGEAAVDYSLGKGISTNIYENESSGVTIEDLFGVQEEPEYEEASRVRVERMEGSYSSIYEDSEGGGYFDPGAKSRKNRYDHIPDEPVKKPRSGKGKKIIAGILMVCLCFVAGFSGAALGNRVTKEPAAEPGKNNATQTVTISGDVESLDAASAIAEKLMPSVVGISTVSQTLTDSIYGLQSGKSTGIGTGLIVTEDGYILTNSHVVNDGDAETITVDLYDGSAYDGTILWNDANLDLAIVKIEETGLQAAEIGDSDTVQIGDYALAIGNPLGLDFERSVTSGIISGLNRSITVASAGSNMMNTMDGLIQTDASINSGNSGGPLINSSGQVIGINSAKASSAEGLGFAIPINIVQPIIKTIIETGTYESAYIGISGYDLEVVKAQIDTEIKAEKGVYISEVYADTGAANAGLTSGDVILSINGTEIDGMSSLKKALVNYAPGDTAEFVIERNGEDITVEVTFGKSTAEMSKPVEPNEQTPDQQEEAPPQNSDPNGNAPGLDDLFDFFFGR